MPQARKHLISAGDLRLLRWAVREAETWEGSMTGNPDPVPLLQFRAQIRKCKGILARVARESQTTAKKVRAK